MRPSGNPKTQQEGPLLKIPDAIILDVLLLAAMGRPVWYARGRVSAAQAQVIARSTLLHGTVATAFALLLVALER